MTEAHASSWYALVLIKAGELDRALSVALQAVRNAPGVAEAVTNLGTVYWCQRRYLEARQQLECALLLKPDDARTHNQLGMTLLQLGEANGALAHFRECVAIKPDYALARSNLMLAMLYSDEVSGPEIAIEAQRNRNRARVPAYERTYANTPDPERRVRLGFVSSDLREHVVALFLLPLLQQRSAAFEYHCYSTTDAPDAFTQLLKPHADTWIEAATLTDAQLAARINADQIDILFDLSGHTAGNRLPLFAQRAAPLQVTWLGYPGTTGAAGIDYRYTDNVLDPPGAEPDATETLIRLDHAFFCYAPPAEWGGTLPVSDAPYKRNGHITLGAFNEIAKVSPKCLDVWAEVLRQVPDSVLVTRARCFASPECCEQFRQQFAARGVAPTRIQPMPFVAGPAQHMAIYREIDIHLDSLPYTGGTTTCDALWMGVPVVTLTGDRPSAQLGADVLSRLGLNEWIAMNAADYVRIAVALAHDLTNLSILRAAMRARFMASALHDASAFSSSFERVSRELWRAWCAGDIS